MKLLIVLCLVAVAVAAPPSNYDVQLIRSENENYGTGSYRYNYELTDGTKQEQQGEIRNQGREDEYLAVKGSYTWIAPNGVKYIVTYTADEEGYNADVEEGPGGAPPALVASLLG